MAQFFFQAADYLTAVFERLSMFNAQLDGHGGDGHDVVPS